MAGDRRHQHFSKLFLLLRLVLDRFSVSFLFQSINLYGYIFRTQVGVSVKHLICFMTGVNVNEKVDHPGNKKIDHPRDKKSESFWGFSCLSVVALLKAVRLSLEYQHMGMVSQSIQESGCQGGI